MAMIEIRNVLQPGKTYRVDGARFHAMRDAYLAVVPSQPPGKTPAEILAAVVPMLPEEHFPGGKTAGWWTKAVQLDLEANGVIRRSPSAPVRLFRA